MMPLAAQAPALRLARRAQSSRRLAQAKQALSCALALVALEMLLVGCAPATTPSAAERQLPAEVIGRSAGSCGLSLAASATEEEAIQAVLVAEGEYVVRQEIDALMRLWLDGATVVDAKNTPNDPSDDQSWRDKDAIRHRYVRTVFPGAPAVAGPVDLEIHTSGSSATVQGTTHIGDEMSPAGDRWRLVKVNGCWLIENLTYNLEPGQP